jgi:Conserved TM helix
MTHTLASVSLSQSVQNLLNTVAHSVPKIAVFVLVMVVGWIIARIVRRVVQALLKRVHFDRMAERGAIGQALTSRGYNATTLLAKIVYYAVLLITLQLAFGVFGPNPVSTMLNAMVGWLPKAVVAIILVVIASAIAKVVKDLVGAAMGGLSYGRFVASAAAVVIIALGVIAALDQIDVAAAVTQPVLITVLATVGAILAIGVGGGMIRPMEQRWERMLTATERETSGLAAYQRGRQDALSSPGAMAGLAGEPGAGTAAGSRQQAQAYASHGTGQGPLYAGPEGGGYAAPQGGVHGAPQGGGYSAPEGGGYAAPEGEGGQPPHMPPGPVGEETPPQHHDGRFDLPR